MRRPGRAPRPRGVFSFETPTVDLPSELTLDTSFVVNALLTQEPHHEPVRLFLERLTETAPGLVFNRLLELELREVAFRAPLIERHGRYWRGRRHDGRSLRRARRLIRETMEAWGELLRAYDYLIVEVHEVLERVGEFMDDFGLSSYDAVHAATAEFAGAPVIVTTDADFAAVPENRLIIVTNAGRVARCRRLRGAASR